ncbi:MAG: PorV/PorQ family protein [Elusimicrobia bacterium]|nr:PorV/PorQ family protein [Elusimicrobiota bacterium]MBD3412704.1 PorV/PorQ family protein [Elusimicrobiota bacterium]
MPMMIGHRVRIIQKNRLEQCIIALGLFLVMIGACMHTEQAYAGGTGGQPGQFMAFGAGARSLAMGKAFLAVSDDASATYWNPAAMTQLDRKEVMALHAELYEDTTYDFLSYVHPTRTGGVFGGNFTRLFSGGFEKVQITIDPSTEEIVSLKKMGTFDNVQQALTLAYGKQILDTLSIGTATKFITNTLDTSANSFFSTDVSLFVKNPIPNYRFAFQIMNLISQTMGDTDDKLPITFRMGNSYRALKNKLLLSLDIDKNMRANMGWHMGTEYWLLRFAALRVGFEGENGLRETSFGLGLKYRDYSVDYAVALHELGMSSRISASWRFGKSASKTKSIEVRRLIQEGYESFKQGNYLMAVGRLNHALEIDPSNEAVSRMVGKLQKVVGLIPSSSGDDEQSELLRKGITSYVDGDNKTALNALRYAYNKHPENEELLRLLNRVEKDLGVERTEKPKQEMIGFTLIDQKLYDARQSMYEGRYDAALRKCQEILDLEPENVTALELMGSAFFLIEQRDKAKAVWEKVLQIDPKNKVIPQFLQQLK